MSNARGKRKEMLPVDEVMEAVEGAVTEPSNKTGVVECTKLNMREKPSITATIISILSKNDKVEIIDEVDNAWYKVHVDGVGTGFCMKEFIN